jgi:hypothetical protein
MIKRDYLDRLIEEITAVAARALGLAKAQRHDEARREIDAAYPQAGVPALVLDRLDPASIRSMVGERTAALVQLLEADADLAALRGDEARASRRRALAAALRSG